ncbi:phosphoenolpyruvate--protein phosphotransferase [Ornithinimicrobium avium]|uniref:Phosphocarrier protein HPr n=1 Tax=Ornithinimicrobium avium TaxID=2283195 RepID=A0A345NIX3_9MICO|nr:phosphoenolpyruvate--protein phosphotransferase [Ornithinimicrobium avium]AXH94981.1 phosphoenolpyruvate--protein phosphotransferase [Ornithinimicrobium avium]
MISLVVVSHSRSLARAVVALAHATVDGDGPHLEMAAGLDEETLGTDATAVAQALVRADTASGGDGVLVLLDLGSAVLSAEMALELVDPQLAARVVLSPAPLVEGVVAASASAAAGADLWTCAREAEAAQRAKVEHLAAGGGAGDAALGGSAGHIVNERPGPHPAPTGEGTRTCDAPGPPARSVELPVLAEHGLHARPAARLVARAGAVAPDTTVLVRNRTSGRGPVDALSLSGVATLDARQGHVLVAEARGPRSEEVLAALVELAELGFGDLPPAEPLADGPPVLSVAREPGIAVTGSGLDAAIGPVVRLDVLPDPHGVPAQDAGVESDRLRVALEESGGRLEELADRALSDLGRGEAEVFTAQATLLRDPQITGAATERIEGGSSAAGAWWDAVAEAAGRFEELDDPYQRERALDVRSVGERVLRELLGLAEPEVAGEGVLVVDELDPGLALALDPGRVHGVLTRHGGTTGHGVLVATARGMPVLTGVGSRLDVPDGTVVAFDARNGRLEVDPGPQERAEFEEMVTRRRTEREQGLRDAHVPALTADHVRVRVKANVASLAVARAGAGQGADGAGLVRTEAVFARWRQAPTVEQQVEVYAALAEVFDPHDVTIRTWDAGADKPLAFMPAEEGRNPFLGLRGLRAFVAQPALLLDQLEAICRVAVDHPLRVLFPMVSTADDVRTARSFLARAAARAGLPGPPEGLGVGIMVEVPAAALCVGTLAGGLDFVSVGSNDLAQYVLAAERGSPALAAWSDPLEPAVLQLVRHVADHVPPGVAVSFCGASASDPDLAGLLVGLGVDELSATASAVPMVKRALRAGSTWEYRELADRALAAPDAAAVRELVGPAVRGAALSAPRAGGTAR